MKFRPVGSQNTRFKITSSPFTHDQQSTQKIMLWVAIAAIPGIATQLYFFGSGVIIQIILAVLTAVVCEALSIKLRGHSPTKTIKDNSALLTGVLLAISIPPLSGWWLIVLGTAFAIIIAKHLYGGLGQNPFNPAMVGYVVLLISFPVQMTSWIPPTSLHTLTPSVLDSLLVIFHGHTSIGETLQQLRLDVDGLSQATPLDSLKTGLLTHSMDDVLQQPILQGSLAGIGWQWVNLAYLVGGLILLNRHIIQWQIPVAFLITLTGCALIGHLVDASHFPSPQFHLLSGATMLGAFFIATDPVSASTTPRGRLIYGALIGLLVWIIRVFGGYPDAIAFAVLLANITVPLIDHYTQPRTYGHRK